MNDAVDVDLSSEEDEEDWEPEGEVDDMMQVVDKIRGGEELRCQITADLKANNQSLPLSKVNQLLILRNFATLRLKGFNKIAASEHIAQEWHDGEGRYFARQVRCLARHYQVFEQLPEGRKGGTKKARTLLLDEAVESAARDWLTSHISKTNAALIEPYSALRPLMPAKSTKTTKTRLRRLSLLI